jgi:hypothetical protein
MVKSKNTIRITAMLIILTLVLIPLLSSNVSALVTWRAGNGWTNNTPPPTGPTAGGTNLGPGNIWDIPGTPTASVIFTFGYTFLDTHGAGSGSTHWVTMTVAPGGTSGTGNVVLQPGGTLVGVHSSPTYTNLRPTTYTITVEIGCFDNTAGPPSTARWIMVTTCTVN